MRRELDELWLGAARELGLTVRRGGDAYVHYDGQVLYLAEDELLDDDDTLAQLILHELCHALVQGEANLGRPDWGLDNTSDRDAVNEAAAVRLQAHWAGQHGLRDRLFPTTVVRDFFVALPDDALLPPDDDSVRLAKQGATLGARSGFARVIHRTLDATATLLGAARHRKSGWPRRDDRRCGDCVWRSDGGFCRQAMGRARVSADEPGCSRGEATLDCHACGACCRSAYDAVLVGPREAVVRRHPELIVVDGEVRLLARRGDHCAALAGAAGGPYRCAIYDDRPRPCRDLALAGAHCLTARRRVGLSA